MTTKFRSLLANGVFAAALAGIGASHAGDFTSGPATGVQLADQSLQLQAVPITACGLKFKNVKEDPKSHLCRMTIKPACARGYNFCPGGVKVVGNKIEYLCFKPQG